MPRCSGLPERRVSWSSLLSKLEDLAVNVPGRYPGCTYGRDDRFGHAGRSADVDVVCGEVGHVALQAGRGQRVVAEFGPMTGDDAQSRVAPLRDRAKLVAEHDIDVAPG